VARSFDRTLRQTDADAKMVVTNPADGSRPGFEDAVKDPVAPSSEISLRPITGQSTQKSVRVAVIGGGAVAERFHLPALAEASNVTIAGLAELNDERRSRLAAQFRIRHAVSDYRALIGSVDAAIVTVPHHLHAAVAVDLLEHGVHVLVEKPMALRAKECDAMIAAADSTGAVLAIGLMRRFVPALKFTKYALAGGLLGDVHHFEFREGRIYDWNAASAFERECGGVLADIGAHVLDLMLWWFGGCASVAYFDDARGGVEADCLIEVTMQGGATGTVELSRSRTLPNMCAIRGSRGALKVGIKGRSDLRVELQGSPLVLRADPDSELEQNDRFRLQLEDFVHAVRDGRPPAVTGAEGRPSVELIERCYQHRQPMDRAWDRIEGCVDREPQ
jgi:predicted dehydrogenase